MHFSRDPSGPNTSFMEGFDVFSSILLSPFPPTSLFGSYSSLAETPSRAGAVGEARFLVSIESFPEFVARLARCLPLLSLKKSAGAITIAHPSGPLRAASLRPLCAHLHALIAI